MPASTAAAAAALLSTVVSALAAALSAHHAEAAPPSRGVEPTVCVPTILISPPPTRPPHPAPASRYSPHHLAPAGFLSLAALHTLGLAPPLACVRKAAAGANASAPAPPAPHVAVSGPCAPSDALMHDAIQYVSLLSPVSLY